MSNYIHLKVWDEIVDPFPNFNGATIEVWEWMHNFIPHFTGRMITCPCWELNHVSRRGPRTRPPILCGVQTTHIGARSSGAPRVNSVGHVFFTDSFICVSYYRESVIYIQIYMTYVTYKPNLNHESKKSWRLQGYRYPDATRKTF